MYNFFLHVCTKKAFPAAQQVVSEFGSIAFSPVKLKRKGLDKALKVLELIVPKTHKIVEDESHHRLIQGCVQDLLEIGQQSCSEVVNKTFSRTLKDPLEDNFEKVSCDGVFQSPGASNFMNEDSLMLFLELHTRGLGIDETTISCIMSSCGFTKSVRTGVQFHALSVKYGFDKSVPVGSSLISLYSKCGELFNANQVFQKMHVKNTVSWTAIITGYAQHCQIEMCLNLFILMMHSTLRPNDFTFASLLSVCTSTASLGLGRSIHCLETRMGFDSYLHISNALISMYAKCGRIGEAHYVFEKMLHKDLISWNSMIFGYAHNGFGGEAVNLLKNMDKESISPDAISFLGVLSSCRHAGLVEEGRWCFSSLLEHGIKPELDHYSCIVDLLGRTGYVEEALDFIKKMPIPPNAIIWGSLLSSCRVHGNVWIGIQAAENRLLLEPGCPATHVQLANLYASVGCWDQVARVRKLMKERGMKKNPGYSWIEVGNVVYRFRAEDGSNSRLKEIVSVLGCLTDHMENLCYVDKIYLLFHDDVVYDSYCKSNWN